MSRVINQTKKKSNNHLVKLVGYKIISSLIGFIIIWLLTKNIIFGVAFCVIEVIIKPISYYANEKICDNLFRHMVIKNNVPKNNVKKSGQIILTDEEQERIIKNIIEKGVYVKPIFKNRLI